MAIQEINYNKKNVTSKLYFDDIHLDILRTYPGFCDVNGISIENKLPINIESKLLQECSKRKEIYQLGAFTWESSSRLYARQCTQVTNEKAMKLRNDNRMENLKKVKMLGLGTDNTEHYIDPFSGDPVKYFIEVKFFGPPKLQSTFELHHYCHVAATSQHKAGPNPSKILMKKFLSEEEITEFFYVITMPFGSHRFVHNNTQDSNLQVWFDHWNDGRGEAPYFLQSKQNFNECVDYCKIRLNYEKFIDHVTCGDIYKNLR